MSTPAFAVKEVDTGAATVRPYVLGGLAALSVGAAAIHFAVVFEHFAEYTLYGVFFLVVAWAQMIWPAVLLWRPSRLWLWLGIAGNAIVVAVYVASRTIGLPFGPDLHHSESVGALDVVSCILEFGLIAGCAALLWQPSLLDRPVALRGAITRLATLVAVPVAVIAATTAVMTPGWRDRKDPPAWHQGPRPACRPPHRPARRSRGWVTWAARMATRTCRCTAQQRRRPRRRSWRQPSSSSRRTRA